MIISPKNPKIKKVRALQSRSRTRKELSAFVIEGARLFEEALFAGLSLDLVLYTEEISARGEALLSKLTPSETDLLLVSNDVFKMVSETQTPQGILAVVNNPRLSIRPHPDFLLIPDGIRDPGNLGTILRTAIAAGVDGVLIPPGTVDPWSPKVVRAGMGAHFNIPIKLFAWDQIHSFLGSQAGPTYSVFLGDIRAKLNYTHAAFGDPLVLIVGGEAHGASHEVLEMQPIHIKIPMAENSESLNAAIAAAIMMFEVVRQRSLG